MQQNQRQMSNFVVEMAKFPYKNGVVLDIRYLKAKNGNIFYIAIDVARRLHGELGEDQTSGQLSRVISRLGYTYGETLDEALYKVNREKFKNQILFFKVR
jgi:hypothetical protein